jgi:SAM-dependent methyltransferase
MKIKKEIRQRTQQLLRQTGLLAGVDYLRYLLALIRCRKSNRAFIREHPGFALPPAHLAFDAYGPPDWDYYYKSGSQTAKDILTLLNPHQEKKNDPIEILDWGCGPGRIVRHLPSLLGPRARVHGSDYNLETIAWARKAIDGVQFTTNGLKPPLAYPDNTFDCICSFSIFTHLSEETCLEWIREIRRVLKNDGLLFFTTHGDKAVERMLLPNERMTYGEKGFLARGKYREGKKMFLSYHSPNYVETVLLKGFEVVEHKVPGNFEYIHYQDAWLARKKTAA